MSYQHYFEQVGKDGRQASQELAAASGQARQAALEQMARDLDQQRDAIYRANERDVEAALAAKLAPPKVERLRLSEKVITEMIAGLRQVAALPDPIGEVSQMRIRPNGLMVGRMRIPLGVIGIIYESRPNVTVDAASLCIKAGNAVILRGGSEAFHSNQYLADLLSRSLASVHLPVAAVQLVSTTDRQAVLDMLKMAETIDVMIPRGGEDLIRFVTANARMPVLKHYKGVCHLYVDESADAEMAVRLVVNAKVQRPGVCNALETLLINESVAETLLPLIGGALRSSGVELRGCPRTCGILKDCLPAGPEDWEAEYLDLILAIRVVPNMDAAMTHIHTYGSHHTDGIITHNYERAQRFVREVQSSLVLVNAPTRLNDGYQLGLGAEIGISTSRLHAFGPMGVEELTTTKLIGFGDGQIRV